MIAQIATKNKMSVGLKGKSREIHFSNTSLDQLRRTVIGKPVTINFGPTTVGTVKNAWIEANSVFIEFEGETFNKNYIVPSLKLSSSADGVIKTVICDCVGLTDLPSDKSLLTLNTLNNNFVLEDGSFYFLDEAQNNVGPFNSFVEANKAMLEYNKLL